MAKKMAPPEDDDELDPDEVERRMDEAVKRMLTTKPETHEAMVKRRRKGAQKTQSQTRDRR